MTLAVVDEARACVICAEHLPLGPRPVLVAEATARIAIIGQAPGTKVHASGVPWDDDSGRRLREWLAISDATFYDPSRVAILPMGFCYPGRKGAGDAPPRPECAPAWHGRILAELPRLSLILLIGMYAQKHYLGRDREKTLTETVRVGEKYDGGRFPLPHPAWRVRSWIGRNPWFEETTLRRLRGTVQTALEG